MKYKIKLLLAKHRLNKKGQYPIYLRVATGGKTSYISTGHYVIKKLWDEKNERIKDAHPDAALWNPEIAHKKQEVIRKLVDVQVKGKTISASELTGSFACNLHDIFEFVEQFSKEVKHKREPGTIENYRKHLLKLKLFHGSDSLNFEDITTDFLARYENSLRDEGLADNYIHALFKTLKVFFNAARKKGVIDCYPFASYENPVYTSPQKDYLTLEELNRWEKYTDTLQDVVLKQTAIYFLLGCYSGLRISDWKAFKMEEHVQSNQIKKRAKKNGEWITMPISKPLQRNLNRMSSLPLTIEEQTINEKLKIIAKSEKVKINKRITSHTARHTFAVTICLGNKISSETAAELMGITLKTFVENYSQVTQEKINAEALAAWKGLK